MFPNLIECAKNWLRVKGVEFSELHQVYQGNASDTIVDTDAGTFAIDENGDVEKIGCTFTEYVSSCME